jgi:hypothetical protein
LYQKSIIKTLSAILILLVFASSITPKKTWHDLIATHQDGKKPSYDYTAPGQQIHKSVIHCPCDLQVAESPYITVHIGLQIAAPIPTATNYSATSQNPHFQLRHFYGLRGPPALV